MPALQLFLVDGFANGLNEVGNTGFPGFINIGTTFFPTYFCCIGMYNRSNIEDDACRRDPVKRII
ncbi:MAG TPA: hypothetical protein VK543_06305 [Puia sp.]|nr:hypothetical protein [Puia sp.]